MNRTGYRTPDSTHWPPHLMEAKAAPSAAPYRIIRLDLGHFLWRGTEAGTTAAVYKMYWGRGPISWLREHLSRFRVEREFRVLAHLHASGVPCSVPLHWSKGYDRNLGGRFEMLATEEIPDATPLHQWLSDMDHSEAGKTVIRAYALIRGTHEAGVHHGAMHPRNILVSHSNPETPRLYIIDVPKAVILGHSAVGTALGNIDLMDFTAKVSCYVDRDALVAGLQTYGLEISAAEDLLAACSRRRRGRHGRNINRARALLAAIAHRKRPPLSST